MLRAEFLQQRGLSWCNWRIQTIFSKHLTSLWFRVLNSSLEDLAWEDLLLVVAVVEGRWR